MVVCSSFLFTMNPVQCLWPCRSGKSTHISKISNSVTHLQSYTNTAIAKNSTPISPVTPCDRDVAAPSADVSSSSVNIVASNDECLMMFHNAFKCFMMFY